MGDVCKLLSKIYGVLGTIGAFALAYAYGRDYEMRYLSVDYERNWLLTIAIFLGTVLSVAIVSVVLHALGDIYDWVQSMHYNSSLLSEDAASGLSILGKEAQDNRLLSSGGWKCPDCGRVNNSYETTCRCGRGKD